MPNIIIKKPSSEPKVVFVDSNTLPDLYKELNIYGKHLNLGAGLLLINQINTDYDEPNFIYDKKEFLGTVYCIRFTKDKIVDINSNDTEYFTESIDLFY